MVRDFYLKRKVGGKLNYDVYLVENEMSLNNVLKVCFENEGWQVKSFSSGREAANSIADNPNLWVLDVNLPDIHGYEMIQKIKQKSARTPVIFISSNPSITDRVLSLELGGDDYLEKPFSPRELLIRSKRLVERYMMIDKQEMILDKTMKLQDYNIDLERRIVKEHDDILELTSKEFDLLMYFARNAGCALSREQILNHVWGITEYMSDRVVDDLIRRLRRRLPKLRIETIYGYGYRA